MNETQEWDDMSAAEQTEIKNRLKMACERADLAGYRARLARASQGHYPQAADRA